MNSRLKPATNARALNTLGRMYESVKGVNDVRQSHLSGLVGLTAVRRIGRQSMT